MSTDLELREFTPLPATMGSAGADDDALLKAEQFAALSAAFAPNDAFVAAELSGDVMRRLAVSAALAKVCETDHPDGRWMLRANERARVLHQIAARGLQPTLDWRAATPGFDDAASDLADALIGAGVTAPDAIDALLQAGTASDALDAPVQADPASVKSRLEDLQRAARALVLAGRLAPAADKLQVLMAVANGASQAGPEPLLEHGVVGRQDLLAWMTQHCRRSWTSKGSIQALFIGGIGGIGKSTLLAECRRQLQPDRPIVVALDFDRPVLDPADAVGLALDVTRQIAQELGPSGASLRELRLKASGAESGRLKQDRTSPPPMLLQATARLVEASKRPVLVLLDTMEVLSARGDEHPGMLLRSLDTYAGFGIGPMAVLMAGRGDPPHLIAGRLDARIVTGLDEDASDELLRRLGVPTAAWPGILSRARGNPLVIRLAARLVLEGGALDIERSGPSSATSERIMAGQLYRLILSRLPDKLAALAHPGLVIRRLNAELLVDVLLPELGLAFDVGQAQSLLDDLKRQTWLVEIDDGWIGHRDDLREVLLPLQIASDPARARRLNAAAAAWFAKRPEGWAPTEALYHLLQARRSGGRLPRIEPQLAAKFTPAMLQELPPRARDALLLAAGKRSSVARAGAAPKPASAARVGQEAAGLLARGDGLEAASIISRSVDLENAVPGSAEAGAFLETLWRSGEWRDARRLLRRWVRAAAPLPREPSQMLAFLQTRAEFDPDGLRDDLRHNSGWVDVLATTPWDIFSDGPLAWTIIAAGMDPPANADLSLWRYRDGNAGIRPVADMLGRRWERATSDVDPRGASSRTARELLQAAYSKSGERELLSTAQRLLAVRLLAIGAPYAAMFSNRNSRGSTPALQTRIDAVSARMTYGLTDGEPAASGVISGAYSAARFDARGRLAEWLGALSVFASQAEDGLLARAAERRRRTLAGQWAYGAFPRGWTKPKIDFVLQCRIAALLSEPDPDAAADAELQSWGMALWPGAAKPRDRVLQAFRKFTGRVSPPMFGTRRARVVAVAAQLVQLETPSVLLPELAIRLSAPGRLPLPSVHYT